MIANVIQSADGLGALFRNATTKLTLFLDHISLIVWHGDTERAQYPTTLTRRPSRFVGPVSWMSSKDESVLMCSGQHMAVRNRTSDPKRPPLNP